MLNRVRMVLVQTSHPGNIGSAARAMKTMGLSRLVLVAPEQFPHPHAFALASGAADVLEQATVVPDLAQALHGVVRAFAVTARNRELSHPHSSARDAAGLAAALSDQGDVAFVFGHETSGLSNAQVLQCQELVHIPANPDYSSLNLAAAVQILAYELRIAAGEVALPPDQAVQLATVDAVEGLAQHLEQALEHVGYLDPKHPKRLMPRLRRLFARARLEQEEVTLLRGVAKQMLLLKR